MDEAAREVLDFLFDSDRYRRTVDRNFRVCQENFGFGKLKELISKHIDSSEG
ncbi:hypothetical protein [Kosmotoga pacifica]|uniref:hypothetical protein n=1 Tax=Kosmotoga pacifica TaxID=1330330 RepID=UPI000A7EB6DE|nr:hypothetical protein [Kosmotoga pacifica]